MVKKVHRDDHMQDGQEVEAGIPPDVRCNALVRIVNHGAGLDLIEGAIAQVVIREFPRHMVPPVEGQLRLRSRNTPRVI